MNTIKIGAYAYPELSEKAKEKVKHWLNEDMQLFDKYEQEYWEGELGKLGYEDCDFAYSISYSQGDGASIACRVDVAKFILRNKLGRKYQSLLYWIRKVSKDWGSSYGSVAIKRSNQMRYVHEHMLYADACDISDGLYDYNKSDKLQVQITELEEMILEEVREKSRELYKQLVDEDMDHFTDEYMIDMCSGNEYLFDEYGDPVHHLEIA